MEFITQGNRIAVENFDKGKLYTVLWKNDTQENLMCISIGADCVVFQGEAPINLFTLSMRNADTIDSIEPTQLGTTNYNNLINKPQINGVDLIGNKTGAQLGLASQSDLEDYATNASVVAGLATKQDALNSSQLQAVNSGITSELVTQIGTNTSAIAGKQDALSSSQLQAVNSGITSELVTQIGTNTSAIAGKQDALSSSQLAAVNSGITSEDVEQISKNKNNISLIKHAANTSIYIQETTPTGAIGDYWLSSANGVKTYGRTEQLFNIDDSNMFYSGYINNNTDVVNYSAGGSKLAIIPCTAGEQYTIAVNSKTLRIAGVATAPIDGATILSPYRYQYDNYNKHTYTYTAPEGAIYLLVNCYLSTIEMVDEKSIDDVFGTLMVNEGSTAAEFAPYYDWT